MYKNDMDMAYTMHAIIHTALILSSIVAWKFCG